MEKSRNERTEAIYAAVTMLAEVFGRKISEPMLRGYAIGLSDIPPEALRGSLERSIRECDRMPTVAEIRSHAGCGEPESASERAIIAWGHVQRTTRLGSYRSVTFDDPAINAAIRNLGGWPEILAKPATEFDTWIRKDFCRIYEAIVRSGHLDEHEARPLPGIGDDQGSTVSVDGKIRTAPRRLPHLVITGLPPVPIRRPQSAPTLPPGLEPRIQLKSTRDVT